MKEWLKAWWKTKLQEWKTIREIERREERIRRSVPYTCFHCELLGICRDESNGWKCRHGCMVLNEERRHTRV